MFITYTTLSIIIVGIIILSSSIAYIGFAITGTLRFHRNLNKTNIYIAIFFLIIGLALSITGIILISDELEQSRRKLEK